MSPVQAKERDGSGLELNLDQKSSNCQIVT